MKENKFEQMASVQQSRHQVKQFKSKQQLKKEVAKNDNKKNLLTDYVCGRCNGRDYRKKQP